MNDIKVKEIADYIGIHETNVRRTYINQDNKANHLRCLRLGTYLNKNNITDEEIMALIVGFKISRDLAIKGLQK